MHTYAKAFVVITHLYNAYCFRGIVGQPLHVETSFCFFLRNKFRRHRQMSGYYLVNCLFQLLYFFFGGAGGKVII